MRELSLDHRLQLASLPENKLSLERFNKEAENLKRESEAGFVPSSAAATVPETEIDGNIPLRLLEAEKTWNDLATQDVEQENRPHLLHGPSDSADL
jgi:hypothetical protein